MRSRNEQCGIALSVLVMFCAVMLSGCGSDDSKKFDVIEFGGHNWIVLDVQDGKALLLSEDVLEERAYQPQGGDVTWESSDIRKYLNTEFFNSFTQADIAFPLDFIVFDSILVSKKERSYFEGDFYRKKRIDYTGKTSR